MDVGNGILVPVCVPSSSPGVSPLQGSNQSKDLAGSGAEENRTAGSRLGGAARETPVSLPSAQILCLSPHTGCACIQGTGAPAASPPFPVASDRCPTREAQVG